ncbi:MAG: KOW domain-containing RNA-binding protein [Ruminococcus sp.]|nr:KOW domain-containing RNA-binding protein [Ruminococcus sp.]
MELKIGSVVRAKAGRDKDGFFVVTAVEKEYCLIADGKSRKLSTPKRKNTKHISLTNSMIDIKDITDKKLRTLLRSFSVEE